MPSPQSLVRVAVLRNQDGLHIASTELKKIKRHKGFVLALCKEDFEGKTSSPIHAVAVPMG